MQPDHYGKAMECLSLAESVREPAERLGLLAIAQSFLRLARHSDARHRDEGRQPQPCDREPARQR